MTSDQGFFRNTSSASELSLDDAIERLNNFIRYGIERIETDESVPEGQFLTNSERTLIRVHPSREAWVKKVLADEWEKKTQIGKQSDDRFTNGG